VATEFEIARRAVDRGLLDDEQLQGCLAERRRLLQDGLDLSLRDLLFDRGLLDGPGWASLLVEPEPPPPLDETRGESEPLPQPPPEPEEVVLGDYRVLGEIGRGAMGVVYEAVQEKLGRRVALKVLPATQALQGIARERFLREAQATASLRHPGIVPIYDIAEERGVHFFAMELLEGRSLRQLLDERGAFEPGEAARVAQAAAEALAYAHGQGVIHRDVKPDNIIIRDDGAPVLTDFGLALRADAATLTRAGTIVGTPLYMAPEQARGSKELDRRVDVYALSVTLYELLAGRAPFHDAQDTAVLIDWIGNREPTPLRRVAPQIPAPLAAIVEVGMEKDPARRYPDAAALAADLGRYRAGEPILARPPSGLDRALRWVRRRRRQVILAAVALLLCVGGAIALRAVSRYWQADGLVLEALRLSDRGQLEAATAALDQALGLVPGLAEAHYQRGELLLARGKRDEGAAGLDEALRRDPAHVGALLARARLRREAGDMAEAQLDLRAALEHAAPSDPRPLLGLGLALVESAPAEALRLLRQGLELARQARSTRDPLYVESVPVVGELELTQGDPQRALPELEEAVRLFPERADPQVLLGRALGEGGNARAAIEAFSAALRRDAEHFEALERRGRAHRELGEFVAAFKDLQAAAKGRASARLSLGLLRFESVEFLPPSPRIAFDDAGAKADLTAAAADERLSVRERAQAWTALAWLQLHSRRPYRTKALERFDRALELLPQATAARLGRGMVLLGWDRLDEAQAEFEAARGLEGGGYPALVGLARVAALRERFEEAERLLDEAVALEPERGTAYGERFRLRLRRGDPSARDDRDRAASLRAETHTVAFDELTDPFRLAEQASARGFAALNQAMSTTSSAPWSYQMSRAAVWLKRGLVYDPASPTGAAWLATALYLNGRFTAAVDAYADAHALDPLLREAEVLRVILRRDVLNEGGSTEALAALGEIPVEDASERVAGAIALERARCLIRLDRFEEALAPLASAEALRPGRWVTASLRARVLTQLGSPDAEAAVRDAARLFFSGQRDDKRSVLFTRAGRELEERDRDKGAAHLLTRAIEADPLNAEAWRQRSKIWLRGAPSELPRGFVDAFVACELDPARNTHRFLELEARINRYAALLPSLDGSATAILDETPELPAASFCRGFMAVYQGRYSEAETWLSRAHELSQGRSYLSLCYRGVSRLRTGKLDEAEADFDLADAVFRGGPVVQFWRACLLARRDQVDDCLAALEHAVSRGWLVPAHLRETPELRPLVDHPRVRRLLASMETD
jgi:tetratricopeptide (TPR) repeat protein/predicted Ser/Thr protein kinase